MKKWFALILALQLVSSRPLACSNLELEAKRRKGEITKEMKGEKP